jgi:outer membrane protein
MDNLVFLTSRSFRIQNYRSFAGLAAATTAFMLAALPVQAQGSLSIPGDWTVTIGAQGKLLPDFEGADAYSIEPVPVFSLRRPGKAARFRSPFDGASISLIDAGGFHFGPVAKFKGKRKESDNAVELRGLGDVDWTIEVGAFAEYWFYDWFRTRAEVRRGFNGHEGIVADLSADVVKSFDERWTISGGPRLTLTDSKAVAPYFGIDAAQSVLSGLPVYDAKGGLHSIGAGLQARYLWTPQWEVRSYVEYSRLMNDVASSPLVTERGSRDQFTVGLGVSYSFDVKLW